MLKISEYFLKHPRISNLSLILILLIGIFSAFNLKRRSYPTTSLDLISITTTYPGAGPEDVEINITSPLEEELLQLDGIDRITSMSMEHISVIMLKMDPSNQKKWEVKNQIRSAVDKFSKLPPGAQKPYVYEIRSENVPILEVTVSGDAAEKLLRQYARDLELQFMSLKEAGGIEKIGYRKREIHINANTKKLNENYVSLTELIYAIKTRNIKQTDGSIESFSSDKKIVTFSEFNQPTDVKDVIIRSTFSGNKILVSDVAEIKDDYAKPRILAHNNGKPAISLLVKTKENSDVITLSEKVHEIVQSYQTKLPANVSINIAYDLSGYTKSLINISLINGGLGFLLVLLVMFLFLDAKTAFWTAAGIPIAMATALALFQAIGLSLNMLSLFAIVLVLGILVDDAIVIAENIYRLKQQGLDNHQATLLGLKEVLLPVTASVVSTGLVFLPMLFMGGMMGKFMFTMPAVVMILLFASLFESVLFLPGHILHSTPPKKIPARTKWILPLISFYEKTIRFSILHRKKMVCLLTIFLISSLAIGGFLTKFSLMNQEDFDIFHIIIETPGGSSLKQTSQSVKNLENIVQKTIPANQMQSFTTRIGHHTTDLYGTNSGEYSNWALITVYLKPAAQREINADQTIQKLKEKFKSLKGFQRLDIEYLNDGPPAGKPINLTMATNDDKLRQKLAQQAKQFIQSIKGVHNVETTIIEGKEEIRLIPDYKKLASAGLTPSDISSTLRIVLEGVVATSIRRSGEEIDFRVQVNKTDSDKIDEVLQNKVSNREGKLLALANFVHRQNSQESSVIHHYNGRRSVTITADVHTKIANTKEINQKIRDKFFPVMQKHSGLLMEMGGEEKELQDSMKSFFQAFIISFIAIYFLLVWLFDSYLQPFLIMLAIPTGIAGVFLTFIVHKKPIDFMALLGVLGLMGVVVNDTIVILTHLNRSIHNAKNTTEAIVVAAKERFRPVVLTTFSTVAGLIPAAYGIGGDLAFMGSMVLAMAWGLLFTTALTLILTPLLFSFGKIKSVF